MPEDEDKESDKAMNTIYLEEESDEQDNRPVKTSRKGMSYAPKAGKQAERTERRHAKKSNDLREFERSKGIPSKQSTLSFKPKVTIPTVKASNPSTSQTQPIYDIDHSDNEIICISPKSPVPKPISINEDSENEEDKEFG
ncbi:hypothetical protein QFC24_005365 [Naganishia onofrii]|uniref:Uncharacterized protein n=1 Tax=Naganishia onofrii TaxID=1851511 RepID=A0ACC2X9V7_9TREE|nr:hypothetical protein QFC24_005365 [Naganishia onofrii]